jgi:hypothetical protein
MPRFSRLAPAGVFATLLGAAPLTLSACNDGSTGCCVVCTGTCPCGNSCVSCAMVCTSGKGCACTAPGPQARSAVAAAATPPNAQASMSEPADAGR